MYIVAHINTEQYYLESTLICEYVINGILLTVKTKFQVNRTQAWFRIINVVAIDGDVLPDQNDCVNHFLPNQKTPRQPRATIHQTNL